MTTDETEMTFEQPRSVFGTWIGVVLLFAIFGLLVWALMGAMPHGDNYESKRATARVEKLKTARAEANTALHGYGWVDKAKGSAHIPIERAMELSVVELAQKKPTAANPIPVEGAPAGLQVTAPNAPSPAPAASVSPAASASPKATTLGGKDSEAHGQPAAAANPPAVAPGTQPGPSATAAASPPAPASKAQPNPDAPTATPVQSAAGTPIPIPGKTP